MIYASIPFPKFLPLYISVHTIQNVPLDIENICLIYVVYLLKRIRLLFGNIITTKSNFMICQGKK